MKNRTLAFFGIVTYVMSVISSATDAAGNFLVPVEFILISGLATMAFVVMAAVRLWRPAKVLAIIFLLSSFIPLILIFGEASSYGEGTILFLNFAKVVAFVSTILVVIKLFKIGGHASS